MKFLRKIRQHLLNTSQFKLYTIYAFGEIALIMIGILLALQIDKWNNNNRDIVEERLVLTRLNMELSSNLDKITSLKVGYRDKEISLKKIDSIFETKNVEHDSTFLSNIIVSSSYGWTVQPLSQTTYDELINTGKFGIIRNIELRSSISQLYNTYQLYERVGLARTSEFSKVVYSIVPMESDKVLKIGLSDKEQKEIVGTLMNLSLDQFIIFEQNRIRLIHSLYNRIEQSIIQLETKIEEELGK